MLACWTDDGWMDDYTLAFWLELRICPLSFVLTRMEGKRRVLNKWNDV